MVPLSLSLYWDADADDVEDIHRYTNGGFHPICLGQVLSSTKTQYRVLHKLGRGSFSTVWLAEARHPSQRYVALKVCVAHADPNHEVEILTRLSGLPNVLQLQDHFSLQGPNGIHTVLVLNVLGNLRSVIKLSKGPQHNLVRKLCHDITFGLAALHRQGIVHGDLHIGNIGISLPSLNNHPPGDILDHFGNPQCTIILPTTWHSAHPGAIPLYLVPPISVVDYLMANDKNTFNAPHAEIMDLGNAIAVGEQPRPACTNAAVCAPELIFERFVHTDPRSPPTRASDIWSLACVIYELVFGRRLFEFVVEITLLGMMGTFCGEIPHEWKGYWESRKSLRDLSISHATAETEWNDMLEHFTEGPQRTHTRCDVKELFALLRSMLVVDPTRRPSAEEILKHPWFSRDETA